MPEASSAVAFHPWTSTWCTTLCDKGQFTAHALTTILELVYKKLCQKKKKKNWYTVCHKHDVVTKLPVTTLYLLSNTIYINSLTSLVPTCQVPAQVLTGTKSVEASGILHGNKCVLSRT
jgi:hypothetical protein